MKRLLYYRNYEDTFGFILETYNDEIVEDIKYLIKKEKSYFDLEFDIEYEIGHHVDAPYPNDLQEFMSYFEPFYESDYDNPEEVLERIKRVKKYYKL